MEEGVTKTKKGEDLIIGIKTLKQLLERLKPKGLGLFFEFDGNNYDVIDVNNEGIKTKSKFISWNYINDREFPDEDGIMFIFSNNANYFYFKLTDSERDNKKYNSWLRTKASEEDFENDINNMEADPATALSQQAMLSINEEARKIIKSYFKSLFV